jgi:osmotically-inducible protein OsmY
MKRIAFVAASIAALTYFFDPENGKRRRHVAADRTAGFFRRKVRLLDRGRRRAVSAGYGAVQKAKHRNEAAKPQPNDATLKAKVESEVFRNARVPKGRVDVNAEDGVVYLRGEVDSQDMVAELEEATRKVQGVRAVENQLHAAESEAT